MSEDPRHYCDEALAAAGVEVEDPGEKLIGELARMSELAYQGRRAESAARLGIRVAVLDKLVRQGRSHREDEQAALPHWNVEPWDAEISGTELLEDIERAFRRYIVLPAGAGVALALWTLHAWTVDAGDISPFLVLVSPTKRCGKTSALIVLYYLTPKSELASNISASALFRYVEDVCPTLLIDEADSFVKDNEEMRGILDSGHTKAAAHVIRNVEVNGEHKPRRFSTWAPKAIATIRSLADTLEDRAIVVQLQRKPKAASVARLRKRDSDEFAILRRQAARWAADTFSRLTDPDPAIPESLNDRAADNWRPLIAIADLAGGHWPQRARESACVLSGEGHDSTSINVELLADIHNIAFGELDVIRSIDLVIKLIADPERPWVEWKGGKPLTQKQLAGLLRPFGIISETVSVPGFADAKGYRRARFEEAWEAYLPGQNTSARPTPPSDPSKRRNADGTGTSSDFRSVAEDIGDGSKNANLFNGHAGSDASTDQKHGKGAQGYIDQGIRPSPEGGTCIQCRGPVDGQERQVAVGNTTVWLHPECERFYPKAAPPQPQVESAKPQPSPDPWAGLEIPTFLRRSKRAPTLGPPGDSLDEFR
jgi:putative DNA primase/helicase